MNSQGGVFFATSSTVADYAMLPLVLLPHVAAALDGLGAENIKRWRAEMTARPRSSARSPNPRITKDSHGIGRVDVDKVKHVLIAGAGPVGAVTGLYLAKNGIRTTLFDMAPKPAEDHRAATLQPSTLDLFEELGLTGRILEQGFKSQYFQWRDRVKDEVVAEFDYGRLSEISGHPYVVQLEQHKTVYTTLEAAKRYSDFVLHRPVEVDRGSTTADHVECDVRDASGEVATHRGDYLVGCDGGRSIVRKTTGAVSKASHGPSVSTSFRRRQISERSTVSACAITARILTAGFR